ncbi:MAG: type II toxin-antitoxin system RelE/ParE family toxin [Terriglobia bacterium]|jgi:plasmid stabilization system protein ParE
MAAKSVEFLEEASAEYEEALDWYLTRSEASASKFARDLAQAIGMIAEAPQRWPAGPHGTRKFLLHRFPFAVVYRELPSTIQILAVAHGHRRPGYWKTRI